MLYQHLLVPILQTLYFRFSYLQYFTQIKEHQIRRLEGEVDILIEIENAGLHPRMIECINNLRLLETMMETLLEVSD